MKNDWLNTALDGNDWLNTALDGSRIIQSNCEFVASYTRIPFRDLTLPLKEHSPFFIGETPSFQSVSEMRRLMAKLKEENLNEEENIATPPESAVRVPPR